MILHGVHLPPGVLEGVGDASSMPAASAAHRASRCRCNYARNEFETIAQSAAAAKTYDDPYDPLIDRFLAPGSVLRPNSTCCNLLPICCTTSRATNSQRVESLQQIRQHTSNRRLTTNMRAGTIFDCGAGGSTLNIMRATFRGVRKSVINDNRKTQS